MSAADLDGLWGRGRQEGLVPCSRVPIREVGAGEPLPPWASRRSDAVRGGMSRAARIVRPAEHTLAFMAEATVDEERRCIAVVWARCEPGRDAAMIRFARRPGASDELMAALFARVGVAAERRGAKWLRWRLASDELGLLDSIRETVGAPVLHREGSCVVAEVAVTKGWRTR